MLATSAISEVQTQAMPSITLPATVWGVSGPVPKRTKAQIQAAAATMPAMAISSDDVPLENPPELTANEASAEFLGIRLNFVEEVAAVETQAVISPSPQTT